MGGRVYTAKGANALFGASLGYAFTAVLIREVSTMWGDKAQVAVRWAGAFLLILLFVLYKRINLKVGNREFAHLFGLSISFTLLVTLFVLSVQKISIANALFVYFASCIIGTFIFGTIVFKEKIGIHKIIASLLAISGLAFFGGDLKAYSSGVVFAGIAGLLGGLCNVYFKLLKKVNMAVIQFYNFGIGTIFITSLMILSGEQIVREFSGKAMFFTFLFVLLILLSNYLLIYGYRYFDINIGAAISASEIVFGAFLGYLFYKEVPTSNEFIGGVLILTGSIIGSLDFNTKTKTKLRRVNL